MNEAGIQIDAMELSHHQQDTWPCAYPSPSRRDEIRSQFTADIDSAHKRRRNAELELVLAELAERFARSAA